MSTSDITLTFGDAEAVVSLVGATLVRLSVAGADLIDGIRPVAPERGYHGALLAPWPIRINDGIYHFKGVEYRLPINDERFRSAMHGLVANRHWTLTARTDTSVRLKIDLPPQPGYPWSLRLAVTYSLSATGVHCRAEAENRAATAAPFGIGFHPYFFVGTGGVDDWQVRVPARTVMEVDDRSTPLHAAPVEQTAFDFREWTPLRDRSFARPFTNLDRDAQGWAAVEARAADGRGVRLRLGETLPWVQLFTADLPDQALRRRSLAIEPLSCPSGAFRTGHDLLVLEPDEQAQFEWTVDAFVS